MKPQAEVQQIDHLSADDQIVVKCLRNLCAVEQGGLDRIEALLRFYGSKQWFVYRGGSHVALHQKSGDDRRMLLVTMVPSNEWERRRMEAGHTL